MLSLKGAHKNTKQRQKKQKNKTKQKQNGARNIMQEKFMREQADNSWKNGKIDKCRYKI